MTAAGARDAHCSNAVKGVRFGRARCQQRARVLNATQLGVTIHPGNKNLLLSTTLTGAVTTLPASTTINVANTLGYNTGLNTISVGPPGGPTCT